MLFVRVERERILFFRWTWETTKSNGHRRPRWTRRVVRLLYATIAPRLLTERAQHNTVRLPWKCNWKRCWCPWTITWSRTAGIWCTWAKRLCWPTRPSRPWRTSPDGCMRPRKEKQKPNDTNGRCVRGGGELLTRSSMPKNSSTPIPILLKTPAHEPHVPARAAYRTPFSRRPMSRSWIPRCRRERRTLPVPEPSGSRDDAAYPLFRISAGRPPDSRSFTPRQHVVLRPILSIYDAGPRSTVVRHVPFP